MRATILVVFVVASVAIGLGGCGEPDDATAKCEQLVDVSCMRAVECGTQNSQAECLAEAAQTSSCPRAKTVKPAFGTCLSDLRQASCASLTASGLPDSCDAVILF
jgi:hypothetical protein